MQRKKDHFQGKDAQHHIVEVQAKGVLASSEVHGAETPGALFAALDAAREMACFLALLALLAPSLSLWPFLAAFLVWKGGRAYFLASWRLEKLHRVVLEEQREIQENRAQEKEELKELYRMKGFEGKLLDDVVDVLMADNDRALRVMLEEEMGFRLEENEHPLIQGLGAAFGALIGGGFILFGCSIFGFFGFFAATTIVFVVSGSIAAYLEKNRAISHIVWTLGLALLTLATGYYIAYL